MPEHRGIQMGELVVQELTGLPVQWLPLDNKGKTPFGNKPHGGGYSLADWELDRIRREKAPAFKDFLKHNPRASFDEWHHWKRAGCFARAPMTKADADTFWTTGDEYERIPVKRFSPEGLIATAVAGSNLRRAGVHRAPNMVKPLLLADVIPLMQTLDTLANAVITVGPSTGTYASWALGLAASSSGDLIQEVDAATYAEAPNTTGKTVILMGNGCTVQNPGASHGIYLNSTACAYDFNVEITGAYQGVSVGTLGGTIAGRISVVGDDNAGSVGYSAGAGAHGTIYVNCKARNLGTGFGGNSNTVLLRMHCGAYKNDTGFANTSYGLRHCLGAGNTVADFGTTSLAIGCASVDGSAPGVGNATGFDTNDCENYAANNFEIRAAVAATTKARFYGHPSTGVDFLRNTRKADGIAFAGPHDPDPISSGGLLQFSKKAGKM